MSHGKSYRIAFYVSGHGYGHCTRAAALIQVLLPEHQVTIVTNAPRIPFASVLEAQKGNRAEYRHALVDPGIVQPKAYDVDREATFQVLQHFMDTRDELLLAELDWLRSNAIDIVLSDSVFIGLAAASQLDPPIPGILVSNFSFDSCYSYLTHPTPVSVPSPLPSPTPSRGPSPTISRSNSLLNPNPPVSLEDQIKTKLSIATAVTSYPQALSPTGTVPTIHSSSHDTSDDPPLAVHRVAPLLNQCISDYASASLLLRLPGAIPIPGFMKCGGKSLMADWDLLQESFEKLPMDQGLESGSWVSRTYTSFTKKVLHHLTLPANELDARTHQTIIDVPMIVRPFSVSDEIAFSQSFKSQSLARLSIPTSDHSKNVLLVSFGGQNIPTPSETNELTPNGLNMPQLLPSNQWIALVCGVSQGTLPKGFYSVPKEEYIPDLTAIADVVLGKLGYGTCSEVISAGTAFVYVPRPLFIEEYGLQLLMKAPSSPVSIVLSRRSFEAGNWSQAIEKAYTLNKEQKERRRQEGGVNVVESLNIVKDQVLKHANAWYAK